MRNLWKASEKRQIHLALLDVLICSRENENGDFDKYDNVFHVDYEYFLKDIQKAKYV